MEFSTTIFIALSAILFKFLEHASGTDPNLPPDVILRDMFGGSSGVDNVFGTSSGSTISNHTDRSELHKLEEEFISLNNAWSQALEDVHGKRIKGRTFKSTKKIFDALKERLEAKKNEIREMKIRMGINPDLADIERAEASSSSATNSSHGGLPRLDTLKRDLEKVRDENEALLRQRKKRHVRGYIGEEITRGIAALQEQEIRLTKEIIAEEMKIRLRRDVEPEEVEQAYIEQKKHERILELQQRKTAISVELEQIISSRGRKSSLKEKLDKQLEDIENELRDLNS